MTREQYRAYMTAVLKGSPVLNGVATYVVMKASRIAILACEEEDRVIAESVSDRSKDLSDKGE